VRPGSWVAVSCGVGCRLFSDLALLQLWLRSEATAPIQPLAWKLPYAANAALKSKKIKKKKKKRKEKKKKNGDEAFERGVQGPYLPLTSLIFKSALLLEYPLWHSGNESN